MRAAAIIAKLAHQGQRYGSEDYYDAHVRLVVRNIEHDDYFSGMPGRGSFDREIAIEAAYLHDTLEDTWLTVDDLASLGIRPTVIAAVETLTKREGEKYEAYIERVSCDYIARRVKMADLLANLSCNPPTRLRTRYGGALAYLLRIEGEA